MDIGSSFLPSDITAAFLYAQLENLEDIQSKRKKIWEHYYKDLKPLEKKGFFKLPYIPEFAANNGNMFYIVLESGEQRDQLMRFLNKNGINAVFHYLSLHKSEFYMNKHDGRELPMCDVYSDCLLRLPFYYELSDDQIDFIIGKMNEFFFKRGKK